MVPCTLGPHRCAYLAERSCEPPAAEQARLHCLAQTAYMLAASCTLQAHTALKEHEASLSLAKSAAEHLRASATCMQAENTRNRPRTAPHGAEVSCCCARHMLAQARAADAALQQLPEQGPSMAAPPDSAADIFRWHMLRMVCPGSLFASYILKCKCPVKSRSPNWRVPEEICCMQTAVQHGLKGKTSQHAHGRPI